MTRAAVNSRKAAISKVATVTGMSETVVVSYFDKLGASGKTSLFGCMSWLMKENPELSKTDVSIIVLEWRDSYGK